MADGQAFFVDANRGDDHATGKQDAPWQTLAHALDHVVPGATLYLRAGVFHENVVVSVCGSRESPITIRSFPGEQAVIDGAIHEFFTNPQDAWSRVAGGAEGEYRSAGRHPNLRNVMGSFGDSMIGLQTYDHAKDLRATNEVVDWEDWDHRDECDVKPLYCGPGLWYDRHSGYIHCRLAHTHLPSGLDNYEGPTDPRQTPLLVSAFRSVPLTVDGGEHVRFQDLVIRGGGYATVELDHARHIEFDNVTIWCGTYGMRARAPGRYGSIARPSTETPRRGRFAPTPASEIIPAGRIETSRD